MSSLKSKQQIREENINNNIAMWCSFWRENPHRFIVDYLGIKLFIFQQILIYFFFKKDFSLFLGSRGLGKTFLVAVFCCARAILYPGTNIVVVSSTRQQSGIIINQKIAKELMGKYPLLATEIKEIKTGINESTVIFKNGSTIQTAVCSDNARGLRCQILVLLMPFYIEIYEMNQAKSMKANLLKMVAKLL